MHILLGLYSYSGYLLFLSSSLVLLYFWLTHFVFCVVGPSLLKLLFSDIVQDFSVSKVTLFPFEIGNFTLQIKASKRKNRSPPITISFKHFAVLLNVKKLFYPILDLLQVLPEEYYQEYDAGYTSYMICCLMSLLYSANFVSVAEKVETKAKRWLLRIELQTLFIGSSNIDFDFFIGPGASKAIDPSRNTAPGNARASDIPYALLTKRLLQQLLLFIEVLR